MSNQEEKNRIEELLDELEKLLLDVSIPNSRRRDWRWIASNKPVLCKHCPVSNRLKQIISALRILHNDCQIFPVYISYFDKK
jgi:hypothetical protein